MSLPLLAAIVVVGIAAVVYAVHRTGGSRVAALSDAEHAKRRFREDFPEIEVGNAVLTENGWTAFLELGEGRTGVVSSVGGRFLTRIVTDADITELEPSGERTLVIRFRDFTWRGGGFVFAAPQDAQQVAAMLRSAVQVEERHARV